MTIYQSNTSAASSGVGNAASSWLRGWWLLAVQGAWAVLTLSCVGLFLAGIPSRYSQLIHVSAALRTTLAQLGLSASSYAIGTLGSDALYLLGSVVIAGLILRHRSDDAMGLFVCVFLVSFAGASSATVAAPHAHHPLVNVFHILFGAVGYVGLNGLFYLFPDGRFVPRWTWIMLVAAVVWQVPFSMPADSPYNPNNWMAPLNLVVLLSIFGTAVFAQIYRYTRVSTPVQRLQTKWVVYGAVAAIVLMLVARSADSGGPLANESASVIRLARDPLLDLGFLLIPLSIGISILRYRLWDIELIINRTFVYGGLTASVVGLYVLIVGYAGTVLRTGNNLGISLLATGTVAVLFHPLRDRLQRAVNRLMYGERDNPYAVLSGLGKRLEASLAPDAALPMIVQTIANALKLPYVAIALHQSERLATVAYGPPVDDPLTLPLVYGSETVGELILAPRLGESSFSPSDRRLLEDLARQAGVAAYAVRLTADLQRSRERLVIAREEERRRLRRDLHDGLGPALATMSMQSEAARDLLASDPRQTDALLSDLTEQLQAATADIRRLVHELRPPALDDLGLVRALRNQIGRFEQSGLRITLDTPDSLPSLPAAVEVAAYRIVLEALNNVVRHAEAERCCVRLSLDEASGLFRVEIRDDGKGLPDGRRAGVGLTSMQERVAELGGACTIAASDTGGTLVQAALPLALDSRWSPASDPMVR